MHPCLNPSCASHGQPHPNCKCYVPAAEGGELTHFCSEDRAHQQGCEHFSEGGEALPSFDDLQADPPSSKPLMFDDLPSESSDLSSRSNLSDFDSLVDDSEKPGKYDSTGQTMLAGAEGVAQGIAGPLATLAETKLLGIDPADISGRAEASPVAHGVGEAVGLGAGLMTGTGVGGLTAKVALKILPKVEQASFLAKAGTAALRGALESGVFAGSDEISKAMLGQGEALPAVASHIAQAGALGLFAGGLFGGIEGAVTSKSATKALEALEAKKLGTRARSFMAGLGTAVEAAKEGDEVGAAALLRTAKQNVSDKTAFSAGAKFFDEGMSGASKSLAHGVIDPLGGAIGGKIGGIPGAIGGYKLASEYISKHLASVIQQPLNKAAQGVVYPALIKALSDGRGENLYDILNYSTKIAKGAVKINTHVGNLFKAGVAPLSEAVSESDRDKVKDYLEAGGIDNQVQSALQGQGFAEGGEVGLASPESNPVSSLYPEQSMMTAAVKGRVSGYLNSIRPDENPSKLPFDSAPNSRMQEKSYERAIDLAVEPLSVLDHVKAGTLTFDHMKHFTQMYPELHQHLSEKITERISQAQLDEEKPAYTVRQSLSLFLGTPLDSTMTPSSLQSIQSMYAGKQAEQQAQTQSQSKAKSKVADSHLTGAQASETRQRSTKY